MAECRIATTPRAGIGVNFGASVPALSRTPVTVVDESASRTLLFGGYRWHNDLAVEAVGELARQVRAAARSMREARNEALACNSVAAPRIAKPQPESRCVYELDHLQIGCAVWTPRLCASGNAAAGGPSPMSVINSRGMRDGMNYGVGMRYDMNSALGLRLEYSRFGRFAGEFGSSLPETDQVTLGVQFNF